MKPPILIGLTLGVGLILGFTFGRLTSSSGTPASSPVVNSGARQATNPGSSVRASGDAQSPGGFVAQNVGSSGGISPVTYAEFKSEMEQSRSTGWTGFGGVRSMSKMMDRLAVSDLPEIARQLLAEGTSNNFSPDMHFILGAYAEQDPDGAWQTVNSLPSGLLKQTALVAVASGIASANPQKALSLLNQIDNAQSKAQVRSTALAHLASKDPREAIRLHLQTKDSVSDTRYDSTVSMIFSQWARTDLDGARSALGAVEGKDRDMAATAIITTMALSDPKGAFELAKTLPAAAESHMDSRMRAIQAWASSDPRAAIEAANTIETASLRAQAINGALATWSRNDFAAALDFAATTSNPTERSDRLNTLSPNSSADREQLLGAVLDYMPPGDSFHRTVSNIFSNWASDDPAAASQAVFRLPPGRVVNSAVASVASNLVRTGKTNEALAWARQLPEGETRLSGIGSIFQQWAATDAQASVAALGNLPPDERERAVRSVGSGWSQQDPEGALQWALTLPSENDRRSVVRDAISNWANTSPEAAARMVERLPDAERGSAMPAVIQRWASKDATSAAEWLNRQPAGPGKDSALSNLARTLSSEDPEAALAMSAQIVDERDRSRSLYGHARTWLRNEPQTARAWIQASDVLPDDTKARLLGD